MTAAEETALRLELAVARSFLWRVMGVVEREGRHPELVVRFRQLFSTRRPCLRARRRDRLLELVP